MNIKQKIKKEINSLTSSYQRAKLVSFFVALCSLLYHIDICIFFYVNKIMPMFYYNFISITVFFVILLLVPRLKSYLVLYAIASAEVLVHQILAEYFLGSYCSFHSFILLMGLMPFLVFENKKRYALPVTIVCSVIYIFFACRKVEPQMEIAENILLAVRRMNITIMVFMIVFVILIYTSVVYRIENYLKTHSESLENEIKMAAIIQQNFFRQEIDNIKKYEVAYFSRPMVGVSGDLYDFYKTNI